LDALSLDGVGKDVLAIIGLVDVVFLALANSVPTLTPSGVSGAGLSGDS
jgi:hypothetical protein